MSYIALATTTLGSAASSVTFSSIPATYKDLILVCSVKISSGVADINWNFNADSGSNYSRVYMYGSGSATDSGSVTTTALKVGVGSASEFIQTTLQIMDYSATDKHKTTISRSDGAASFGAAAYAGRWANTNAITTIAMSGVTFQTGSTFSLYGVA